MSLGFNHNRKHRSSTLPGAVNPILIRERRSTTTAPVPFHRKSPPASQLSAPVTSVSTPRGGKIAMEPSLRRKVSPASTQTHVASVDPAPTPLTQEPTPVLMEDMHTVYGTVSTPLFDENGNQVAEKGRRAVLVYPMSSDADDGRITMRMKNVDPNTAQLSYTTVTVYDPNTDTRYVTDFSLTP